MIKHNPADTIDQASDVAAQLDEIIEVMRSNSNPHDVWRGLGKPVRMLLYVYLVRDQGLVLKVAAERIGIRWSTLKNVQTQLKRRGVPTQRPRQLLVYKKHTTPGLPNLSFLQRPDPNKSSREIEIEHTMSRKT